MGLDFSCFGDTTNCDISLSTIKVPELESDTKIPPVELPKPESSDLVIKDTFLPLELAKLAPLLQSQILQQKRNREKLPQQQSKKRGTLIFFNLAQIIKIPQLYSLNHLLLTGVKLHGKHLIYP
ncbi:MAG: hypothetical protein EBR67_06170 [Proteobacteria bacterium]|nr:hypothetical protein [Pseudomonadota bacterium]